MPVNAFAIAFAESGYGKNYSQNILEGEIFNEFEDKFMSYTYRAMADQSIASRAVEMAASSGEDINDVEAELRNDFAQNGHFLFAFPEGTSPALKQLSKSINLAGCGAASLEMDEIGSNLLNNSEIVATFLELYDVGHTKDKLIKVTKDSKRSRPVKGHTPANFFGFGTPVNVFDGSRVEEAFLNWCRIGYGRRCFFAYGDINLKNQSKLTRDEIFAALTNPKAKKELLGLRAKFGDLARLEFVGKDIMVNEETEKFRMDYQAHCNERAEVISEYKPIERTEMTHRHVKALKLAGAYAFVDGSTEVSVAHLQYAIAVTERSGDALYRILNQPRPHIRLANFLVDFDKPVTESDLLEFLPFYAGSVSHKRDLMNLAMSYGYKRAMAITAYKEANVNFYTGTALTENDLSECIISTAPEGLQFAADGYSNGSPSFAQLPKYLANTSGNFCNHWLEGGDVGKGKRSKATTIAGCNMVVFDVDSTKTPPEILTKLLGEYNHIIYTTKSHTAKAPRYRLILPLSHKITLEDEQYKTLCKNIAYWLPVEVDLPALQRERKYRHYANSKVFAVLDKESINVMPYYPNTQQCDELDSIKGKVVSLSGMKRWVVRTATEEGNRNNTLHRYASFLSEHSKDFKFIEKSVNEVNGMLPEPLSESEIAGTVLKSIKAKLDGNP